MPFNGPGPGRPKGGLNKTTKEVRDLARTIVNDPDYREKLRIRVACGDAPHMETLLWHYAYGKPKDTVEISGVDGEPLEIAEVRRVVVRASDVEKVEESEAVH